jgi:sulfotransferase family protein
VETDRSTDTARSGPLPTFLVIGAYKAATTAVTDVLADHPHCFVSSLNEPSFFVYATVGGPGPFLSTQDAGFYRNRRTATIDEYRELFTAARGDTSLKHWGEGSPEYLRLPETASIIAEVLGPEAKMVCVLRDPVHRAYSDYLQKVRDGIEDRSFDEAMDDSKAFDPRRPDGTLQSTGGFRRHYVATSRYAAGVAEFQRVFGARLLVVVQESFSDGIAGMMTAICKHLDLDVELATMSLLEKPRNRSGVPRNKLIALLYRIRRMVGPLVSRRLPRSFRAGTEAILARGLYRPTLSHKQYIYYRDWFADDIAQLASILELPLDELWSWRETANVSP